MISLGWMWLRDVIWWARNRHYVLQVMAGQSIEIDHLQREVEQSGLEYARNLRDLIVRFRIAIETPEDDIRDALDEAIRDLDDEVARAEEHIVT